MIKQREEQYRKDYENEVRERSKESAEMQYQINDLQEQLQEYEEEHYNLLTKVKEMEAHAELNMR